MARAWIILLASAVCEAVWATALGESDGLRQPAPSVVFAVGLLLSMLGLGRAMKRIPIGTAYAVWVGVGAARGGGVSGPGMQGIVAGTPAGRHPHRGVVTDALHRGSSNGRAGMPRAGMRDAAGRRVKGR